MKVTDVFKIIGAIVAFMIAWALIKVVLGFVLHLVFKLLIAGLVVGGVLYVVYRATGGKRSLTGPNSMLR
jgi:hypothetical protein